MTQNYPSDRSATSYARVLLVDDSQVLRLVTERILRAAGHRVISCDGVHQALTAFGDGEAFDNLVTDIFLGADSGIDLAVTLTKKKPTLSVTLMSGYDPKECDGLTRLRANPVALLMKPFGAADLLGAITAPRNGQ